LVTSGELQLGLVSVGDPISKELDCFGRPCRLAAPTWRHHPRADLAKDALSVAWVAHVIEVIQRNAEVPHVRNIDVGKQRPDVLREANCYRPTPISVSSDTGSHSRDWSVSAEVPLAAGRTSGGRWPASGTWSPRGSGWPTPSRGPGTCCAAAAGPARSAQAGPSSVATARLRCGRRRPGRG
jgi:hypothetical protein